MITEIKKYLQQFNGKVCTIQFKGGKCYAIVFDPETVEIKKDIAEIITDQLLDELSENKGFFPFCVFILPDDNPEFKKIDLNNKRQFLDNLNGMNYLMIHQKTGKIIRSGWGKVKEKLEDLNVEIV